MFDLLSIDWKSGNFAVLHAKLTKTFEYKHAQKGFWENGAHQ